MEIFDILGKEIDNNVVDVDQLMEDVEQLQSQSDLSIPISTLRPVSTFITGKKSCPINKPSWNGRLSADLQPDSDEDESQQFRCGR